MAAQRTPASTRTLFDPLLQIRDLHTHFHTPLGTAKAVDGVSLHVEAGEVLGIVGESGCGKSVLALSVTRLLPMPPAVFAGGEILFRSRNLLKLPEWEIRSMRGNEISMIFQEPMTALNPVFTIGNQLIEVVRIHQKASLSQATDKAVEMLDMVGLPSPRNRLREYPHQLSGGLRQRVMIAIALACRPSLLIADEPTTALDVTIQAQILELMERLRQELGMAIVMITHDLGVIAEICHRVAVIYAGKMMEQATTLDLFDRPLHPYTRGLMQAIPSPEASRKTQELYEIQGVVPSLFNLPPGCRFHPRCPLAQPVCMREEPPLREISPGHLAACWMAEHV
ncbi:MAG: ABC transporter ATP-binding protein [Syntrophobacteraceae bacterium]|nr:ABC transporter ATP-binding protein [Desulfobacteraceae bacterium]